MPPNDTKPSTPHPWGMEIPVKVLRFRHDLVMEIGNSNTSAIKTEPKGRFTITFFPSVRHFHVMYRAPENEPRPYMIHESMVQHWEPAA